MKLTHERFIPEGSQHLRYDDINVDAYISEVNNGFTLLVYSGRRKKHDAYVRYTSLEKLENSLEDRLQSYKIELNYKQQKKEEAKAHKTTLKKALKKGTLLHTSFSYNMTFNYFFRVVSNKGTVYTLEVISKELTSGDGFTGRVKAGERTGTFVQGKLTSNGLKIDRQYASIITEDQDFYENHLD